MGEFPGKSTQFKKGTSGNPGGRPKITFSGTVRELMEAQEIDVAWTVNGKRKTLHVESDKNLHYGVASALIMEALKGNVGAVKELIDRGEGRAHQSITVDGSTVVSISEELVDAECEDSDAQSADGVPQEPSGS